MARAALAAGFSPVPGSSTARLERRMLRIVSRELQPWKLKTNLPGSRSVSSRSPPARRLKDARAPLLRSSGCSEKAVAHTAPHPQQHPAAPGARLNDRRAGSPRELAKPGQLHGQGDAKPSRAPPCLWAGALLPHGLYVQKKQSPVGKRRHFFPSPGDLTWEQRPLKDGD